MDRHSEVEVKFEVGNKPVAYYMAWVSLHAAIKSYLEIGGWDIYWERGADVVRHRFDDDQRRSILTVKKRKSPDSIVDRHEVDLPLADSATPADVTAFLGMTGWRLSFVLYKRSYIFHAVVDSVPVCFALYSVQDRGGTCARAAGRFLEVEVEKDAGCSMERGRGVLDSIVQELKLSYDAPLTGPLNSSLLEMFRPREGLAGDRSDLLGVVEALTMGQGASR